ncbi:MAG: MATE family efflux transporter [Fusicatenibacter saccharivorans]
MTKTVQKSKARDMTQGSIWKQLLLFSLPLMAGNLFQQLYNTVDSIVVGNFVGKEALAAVGSVGPIINSLIGFFMGLSTGAGVIISQYYGAKADEKVSRTVSTTLVMTFISLHCLYYSRHLHYTVHAPHDEYAERCHP